MIDCQSGYNLNMDSHFEKSTKSDEHPKWKSSEINLTLMRDELNVVTDQNFCHCLMIVPRNGHESVA